MFTARYELGLYIKPSALRIQRAKLHVARLTAALLKPLVDKKFKSTYSLQ